MKRLRRTPLNQAVSMALVGSAVVATLVVPAHAAESVLEEITVTAQKRTENLQDVPVSIQVLDSEALENLEIKGFEDYIQFLPTVSYTSNGPGYGQLYMRGVSSGGDGNHSASMPSIGYYLDEQPVTTINSLLDVHIYDVARIETLSGPQGTLYGQGSQAGTVRIITNKPVIGEFQAGYDVFADTLSHGDSGYGGEAFVNIPISDRMAVRLVGWYQDEAGWIDNVEGELLYPLSLISRNNASLVEDDWNTVTTAGLRAQLKIDLSENWTLTPGLNYQDQSADGQWYENSEFTGDEYQIASMVPAFQDEDWYQASLTLEGKIGNLDLVYAGAYLDRDVEQQYDYAGYSEYLEYLYDYLNEYYYGYQYYYCLYYDAAHENCVDPTQYEHGDEQFERMSHELRLQSSQDGRLRWIAGLFYQRQEHFFDLQWIVPAMDPARSVVEGGVTTWQTHQKRVDHDEAIFGELYFDITETLTATFGARYFEYDNSLFGFNGFIGHCTGYYDENGDFVEDRKLLNPNSKVQYPCYNTGILDNVSKGDDWAFKGNLEWEVADDKLLYITYSEGFRAGGANRARIIGLEAYQPDFVYNYEFGWKTMWAGGKVRFNGAAYFIDWKDFQYGFLNFELSNLTIVQNAGNAEIKGFEFELEWAATDNLTLSLASSYNNGETKSDFWIEDKDRLAGLPPDSPSGTPMPYVPEWQYTAIGRWNFAIGELPSFAQAAVSYRDNTWTDLEVTNERRFELDSYAVLNASFGFEKDNWTLSFYGSNLTDERGEIDREDAGYPSPSGFEHEVGIIRPRSYGIRWSQRF